MMVVLRDRSPGEQAQTPSQDSGPTGPAARTRVEPLAVTGWSLMANTVVTSALGVVFWAIASRLYSPNQIGEGAALVSAMILLSTISQMNLAAGIARLLPQVRTGRWRPVLGAYAATAVVGAVLTVAFLFLVPRFSGFAFLAGNYVLGSALLGAVVLWNLFSLQDAVLTSARWAPAVPIENGLFGLLKIALMVGLAGGLLREGVFYAWLIGMAVLLLPVNVLIFAKVLPSGEAGLVPLTTALPLHDRGRVARYLAVDYAAAMLSQGSTALLPLLVVGVLGRAENAYFYIAFLIAGGVSALAQSLSISLVVEGAHDEANVVALARRSARRYVTFVVPAVALMILAAPLVLQPFGVAYVANGTTLLRLLLAGTTVHSITVLYMSVQRLRGRVSRILAAEAAVLTLVSVGGILGMQSFGLEGLGVAWFVAQAAVAMAVLPALWNLIGHSHSWQPVPEVVTGDRSE